MTVLHVVLEEIILVRLVPQGVKPSTKGSAFQSDVSIEKAGLDLASPRSSNT